MHPKLFLLLAAGLAALIPGGPLLADTKAGVDAWSRGDFAAAARIWQAEAARGDADALFNLAQAHKLGRGVKQDLAKAEELFGRAAAQGHLQAGDNYGLLLFQRGQRSQALPFIRAAADRGEPRAQYLLGIGHFNGDIVPRDWVRAYALVSLAQQAGLEPARSALGQMDAHVPMDQRQQAIALASELRSQAEATRARQLAAADLGATVPIEQAPVAAAAMRAPRPALAAAKTIAASGDDAGPASAGADFARPAQVAPPRSAPAAAEVAVAAAAPPARTGPWRVQLGAFGMAANADALWNRLKDRPELAGRTRIKVKTGAVTRLQAGGFASEAQARAACTRLSQAGQTCIVVRD